MVEVCGNCRQVLEKPEDMFTITIFSKEFWDGADTGRILENNYYCFGCAKDVKTIVINIEQHLKLAGIKELK